MEASPCGNHAFRCNNPHTARGVLLAEFPSPHFCLAEVLSATRPIVAHLLHLDDWRTTRQHATNAHCDLNFCLAESQFATQLLILNLLHPDDRKCTHAINTHMRRHFCLAESQFAPLSILFVALFRKTSIVCASFLAWHQNTPGNSKKVLR